MSELGRLLGRVSLQTSDPLTYLHDSVRSGWSGATLTHMKTTERGSFEGCWNTITLGYRLSQGGNLHVPDRHGRMQPSPARLRLWAPYERARGVWEESSETINLFISPQLCEQVLGRPLATNKLHHHAKHLQDDPVIGSLLKALLIDSLNGSVAGPTLGDNIIAAIIHRLDDGDAPLSRLDNVISYNETQIARVKEFIEANLSSKLSLVELAEVANLSVRHFCRAFRGSTGSTPHQYIVLRRLENAKTLILNGQLSLQEIAAETGFVNHNHLSTTFRKVLGTTPSQFRNSLR